MLHEHDLTTSFKDAAYIGNSVEYLLQKPLLLNLNKYFVGTFV